jgi:hypothetical protein
MTPLNRKMESGLWAGESRNANDERYVRTAGFSDLRDSGIKYGINKALFLRLDVVFYAQKVLHLIVRKRGYYLGSI